MLKELVESGRKNTPSSRYFAFGQISEVLPFALASSATY